MIATNKEADYLSSGFAVNRAAPVSGSRHKEIRKEAIIDNLLLPSGMLQVTGCSKAGKSWILIQAALLVSNGKPVFGHQVKEPMKVLYFNGEICAKQMDARVTEMAIHAGLSSENLHVLSRIGAGHTPSTKWHEIMSEAPEVAAAGYKVLVIDPISSTYDCGDGQSVDENSNDGIYKHLMKIREAFSEHGVAVMYAHHHTKSDNHGDAVNAGSGAGAFGRVATAFIDMGSENDSIKCKFKSRAFKQLNHIYVKPLSILDEEDEPSGVWFEQMERTPIEDMIRDRILDYLKDNPESSKTKLCNEVTGKDARVREVVDDLVQSGVVIESRQGKSLIISLPAV